MKNKKIYYVIGGLAVLGIGYYLWNKNKKSAEVKETSDTNKKDVTTDVTAMETPAKATSPTTSTAPASTPSNAPITTPANTPLATTTTSSSTPIKLTNLEVKKRIFDACGIQPPSYKKQARNLYDDCKDRTKANLKSQGYISFEGMNTYSNMSSDFDISFR
jgi:hypothetical protein